MIDETNELTNPLINKNHSSFSRREYANIEKDKSTSKYI